MINISRISCSWRNKTFGIHLKFCKRKKYFNRTINYQHVGTFLPPTPTAQFRLPSQEISLTLCNTTVQCRGYNVPYLLILPPGRTYLLIVLPVFDSFPPWLEPSRSRVDFVPESGSGTVVLNSLSVGIRWITVNALVFGRELRFYFLFSWNYASFFVCLQRYSVKVNFNVMGYSVISLFCRLSILSFGVFLTTGTESLPKRYLLGGDLGLPRSISSILWEEISFFF